MDIISQVKQLISEINRLHSNFSHDYFETGKIETLNLSKTMRTYRQNISTNTVLFCTNVLMII